MFALSISKKMISTLIIVGLTVQCLVMPAVADLDGRSVGSRIAETGKWTALPDLGTPRYDHTMVIFENDSLMVIGGFDGTNALGSAEIYNPFIGDWIVCAPMHVARYAHASVTLSNKSVLVLGGYDGTGNPLRSTELYDAQSNVWYVLDDMPFASGGANLSAVLLVNGSVLVVGGNGGPVSSPVVSSMAAIFDATNSSWSTIDTPFVGAMGRQSLMLLNNTVLSVGGSSGSPWYKGLQDTEIFDPITKKWSQMDDMSVGRSMFRAVLLNNGHVLATGGIRQFGLGFDALSSTERFNTTSGAWESGPALLQKRYGHTASVLPDNEVIVAGGMNSTGIMNSTEIIQLGKGQTVASEPMHVARTRHAAVRTNQGNIVVTGGIGLGGAATNSTEAFTPGLKQDVMTLELFGSTEVQSEGALAITAHIYNETIGDLSGALVTFLSGSFGSFDVDAGLTDDQGVIGTVYHAPRNPGTQVMTVVVTVTADLHGYKGSTHMINIDVYPETSGEPMGFNDSINHVAYLTTYQSGSIYTSGSHIHSGYDFLGDEQVKIDGTQIVAANFSVWENVTQSFDYAGMTQIVASTMHGNSYFDYDLQGTVYTHTIRTTRSQIFNSTYHKWYNISEETTTRQLPAMRGINTSISMVGTVQDVVNTVEVTSRTVNLDTGASGEIRGLRTEPKSYMLNGPASLATVLGVLQTNVFVDESGQTYYSYANDLGILVQEVQFNETGAPASTRALLEYNDFIGTDPTSPLLIVEMTIDSPSVKAGKGTTVHVVVTGDQGPVENASVEIFAPKGCTVEPISAMTDEDGRVDFAISADRGSFTQQLNITVTANKAGYREGWAKGTITIIEDNSAPAITHRAIDEAEEGKPLEIYSLISDDVGVQEVSLHYRIGETGSFMTLPMELFLGAYMASIPSGAVTPPLLQYYITAKDVNGNLALAPVGAPANPNDVMVLARERTLPPVSAILDWGGTATVTATVRGNLTLTIAKATDPSTGAKDTRFLGLFAEVKAVGTGQLVWANISFSYNDYLLGHLADEELKVYWFNDSSKDWTLAEDTGVMTYKQIVWANVSHLTVFAPRAQNTPVIPPVPDTIPPTVTIVSPSDKAQLNQGIIKVMGTAKDNAGLYSVQVNIDNSQIWVDVWVPEGAKSAVWMFNLSLAPGEHVITVRAKDQAGIVGNETTRVITVLKEAPEGDGVTMRVVLSAAAALMAVILVIVILIAIGGPSSTGPDKPRKDKGPKVEEEDDLDEDEEIGEEE